MNKRAIINNRNYHSMLLVAAFAAVYVLWGSTYLAIKYAIESLPTFLMAGTRFLIAGAVLYAVARFSENYQKPKFEHWRTSFIVGTLLLLGGNGGVVLAEHYLPSSMAALLVATEPFWIVLLSWLWLKQARPNLKVAVGLLFGFIGVYLLLGGQGLGFNGAGMNQIVGSVLVIMAALSWAFGSIYGLRAPTPNSPVLAAGMQMLAGGLVLTLVGTFSGEWNGFDVTTVTLNSWLGLAYLTVFGSIVAFTAYSWLLKNAQPALVATYAFVNPVIAVFLGWLIAGETFTSQMFIGAAVIVGSVALITSQNNDKNEQEVEDTEIHNSQCQPISAST